MDMYKICNEELAVEICEEGAELFSIKDSTGKEYLWQGDPEFWRSRSPILFPFVARLKDKTYLYHGEEFHMNIHGFARNSGFRTVPLSDREIRFELESNEFTYKQYPFRFLFTVTYRLEGNVLKTVFDVFNRDEKEMFFGIGAHPGFKVGEKGSDFTEYRLRFKEKRKVVRIGFTDDCFVDDALDEPYLLENDCILNLRHDLFDHDAIVLRHPSNTVTIERKDGTGGRVTISYPDTWYVGFWHAVGKAAPYVCVEPWGTLPAKAKGVTDFGTEEGLFRLVPNGHYNACWQIGIEKA